ncbi:chromosome segregation protein SMC [Marinicauda salina]|uniref:Chromosome partition protein Smc n=1 Tax=Marinicauda salina TaxID=2135793 RepID=A0A2U2BUH0_9PROT|nr:chromosome segregation protein SMC [Marinicauda salina]PWE17637.1 chromosome segregation protein SMC [Marinicauda salina]
MKFTQLRLAGFKSFVDPAELRIDPGLTGVIGPNGCGKSNLLEALRWVMGATSAKSLRGSGMEDVIFAGTENRPARDRAEVTLRIDNTDRTAPARFNDADELEVVRRIARGKGSDYRVNGEEVRAKDVQLLFADAGTGANSPALVRQGQISELINAKPENRRRILEEAAGVAGLRARRHEARLRLNAAEANLDRLQEVVEDLENRHGALQRQARQASRYRKLSATIRELEALLWLRRWREAGEAVDAAERELAETESVADDAARRAASATSEAEKHAAAVAPLREAEAEAAAALRRLERERDGLERDQADAEAEIERLSARIEELKAAEERETQLSAEAREALERVSSQLVRLREEAAGDADATADAEAALETAEAARGEAERELDACASAAADARARRDSARRAAEDARSRAERLERQLSEAEAALAAHRESDGPDMDALEAAVAETAQALEAARRRAETAETGLAEARERADAAREAARTAESEKTALAREIESLERLLASDDGDARALDAVRAEAGYEQALAAALGEDLEASLDAGAARRWTRKGTRAAELPDGATPLTTVVSAPDALAARLAAIGVVDADDIERLAPALKPGQRLVTRDGALRRWDGYVAEAGAPSAAAARLEHRNRLSEARRELADAKSRAETLGAQAQREADALRAAEAALRDSRDEVRQGERALRQAESELADGREREARDSAKRASLTETVERLRAEGETARNEAEAAERALAEIEEGDDGGEALEAARSRAETARRAAADARAELDSVKRDSQARRHRIAALEREEADWSRRAESAGARLEDLASQRSQASDALEAARARPGEIEARRVALMDRLGEAESAERLARDRVAQAETAQREADAAQRAAERDASAAREARAAAGATLAAAKERLSETVERVHDATGDAPEALASKADDSEYAGLSAGEIERRLDEARLSRERLGAVNLRADEEAETLQAERDEITRERDDLVEAVARLRKAVETLSREGRARLLEAFDVVNGHFQTLFATLFDGGRAELHLTESDDPLEAGLEVYACPPGKKLETMSLMSGGEQALTATALIFAVFLSNPAPVCVLDEVDAPLDDANVDRFCRMLDEMCAMTETRFLIITHNPVTMARVDRLFGVTMGERGVSQLVSVNLKSAEAMLAAE